MQPLHVLAVLFALGDDEDDRRVDVNHRGGTDANFGMDVRRADIGGRHAGSPRSGPMSRADHARLPEWTTIASAIAVGVERVYRIMFCNNKNDVMRRLVRQREIANIERLRINLAIHRVAKQLAKSIAVDIGRSENGFLGILALVSIVIAPGQHIGGLRKESSRRA